MSLLGGFSQLILPEEIEQVEPIVAINGASNDTGATSLPYLWPTPGKNTQV